MTIELGKYEASAIAELIASHIDKSPGSPDSELWRGMLEKFREQKLAKPESPKLRPPLLIEDIEKCSKPKIVKKESKPKIPKTPVEEIIDKYIKTNGISRQILCDEIGVDTKSFRRFVKGESLSLTVENKIRKHIQSFVKGADVAMRIVSDQPAETTSHRFDQADAWKIIFDYSLHNTANRKGLDCPAWAYTELIRVCDKKIEDIKDGRGDAVKESLRNGIVVQNPRSRLESVV